MRKPIYIKLFTYTLIIAEKHINIISFAENGFVLQKKAKAFQTPYHSERLFLILNFLVQNKLLFITIATLLLNLNPLFASVFSADEESQNKLAATHT